MADAADAVLLATRALVGVAARSLTYLADDVSLVQYRVLVLLAERGPSTMGALTDSLDVNPSTATRVCDRLVDKRLVRRRVDDEDRRSVHVALTARGRRLIDEVMQRRREEITRILKRMGTASRQRLAAALDDFAVAARESGDDAWELGWHVERHRDVVRGVP